MLRPPPNSTLFPYTTLFRSEGKLFGSVTAQDLVDFLGRQGVKIERRRVQLDEPIKTLGETSVPIRLHPEVTAQLRVKDRKSTRLNSSHRTISYAVFCLKKKI